MIRTLLALVFACFAIPSTALEPGKTGFTLGASTLGVMVEARHKVNYRFALRGFVAGALSQEMDETIDGVEYEVDASLGGIALLGDFYPTGSGFHLSAGLFMATGDFEANASDSALEVGGSIYNASIRASAEFENQIAPMVTLGYDQSLGESWSIGAEIGAIAIGGITVDLEETTVGGNVIPTSDLNAELDEIEDDLSDVSVYPYLALKATYRF